MVTDFVSSLYNTGKSIIPKIDRSMFVMFSLPCTHLSPLPANVLFRVVCVCVSRMVYVPMFSLINKLFKLIDLNWGRLTDFANSLYNNGKIFHP